MSYDHVIRAAGRSPWAILPEKAEEMAALLTLLAAGGEVPVAVREQLAAERQARVVAAQDAADGAAGGSVAVLPLYGLISQRANLMNEMSGPGGTSVQKFTTAFRQALADPSVAAIVLDVDSPGGNVFGVAELADEIRAARARKPIVAVANSTMASAAYWVASAASEISVTPGGQVGSIGVLALHVDESARNEMEGLRPTLVTAGRYKGEASPDFPLTDEARASVQDMVDSYYASFVDAVAASRGVSAAAVRAGYGEGRMLMARPALRAGMVDRIETLDQAIARMMRPQGRGALTRRGAGATAEETADGSEAPPPASPSQSDPEPGGDVEARMRRLRY